MFVHFKSNIIKEFSDSIRIATLLKNSLPISLCSYFIHILLV